MSSLGKHWKLSEETKKRMSISSMGKPGTNTGKHFTDEHKRKLSESNKGKRKNISPEMRKLMSDRCKFNKPHLIHGKSKTPEYKREMYRKWVKDNYKKKLWHNLQRRKIKLGNNGSHTFGEWENLKAQYNWTCLCCKKSEPIISLTEDHIIPLSKGGSDNIENIQPLCRSCNCKKHTKIINYDKSLCHLPKS